MSSHQNLGQFRTRSLLGSVLLTLAVLLVQQVSFCEGRVPLHARDTLYSNSNSNYNNKRNDLHAPVAMAPAEVKRHEGLWKRRQGHSPFTNNDSPAGESLTQTGGGKRRRSLFSHVNDDLPPPEPERPSKEQHVSRERQEQFDNRYHSDQRQQQQQHRQDTDGRDPFRPPFHEQEPEDTDIWRENESQTLIEPHYPSIDLFEEEDDDDDHNNSNSNEGHDNNRHTAPSTVEDDEDEELLELGEDGVFRRLSVHLPRTNGRLHLQQEQQHQQQVWMVDEWEEDLEGEMDELLDWAEDEEHNLLERFERLQKSGKDLGSEDEQLRDQESSLRNFVLEDEDEASPFERIFSESWLF